MVIRESSFDDCVKLETMTFSKHNDHKLEVIGNRAFKKCHLSGAIQLPATVVCIGDKAFMGCAFTDIELPAGLHWLGHSAFSDCLHLRRISIPKTLNKIQSASFEGCSALTEVHFQEGLEEIGRFAFAECPVRAIALPTSLLQIDVNAFSAAGIFLAWNYRCISTCGLPPTNPPPRHGQYASPNAAIW